MTPQNKPHSIRDNIPSYDQFADTSSEFVRFSSQDWKPEIEAQKFLVKLTEIIEFHKIEGGENRIIPISTITHTRNFIYRLVTLMEASHLRWLMPHVAVEDNVKVVLEWWNNDRNLSFYIGPDGQIEFLNAWGPNIWHDMKEGIAPTDTTLIDLWIWLNN